MKNNMLTIGAVLALVLLVVFANQPETLSRGISLWDKEYIRPPFPDAGWDIVTYVGSETHFDGQVKPGDGQITSYEWDFDGDGTFDWFNSQSGFALHTYLTIGQYQTFFKVTDEYGLSNVDTVEVIVKPGKGPQRFVKPKVKKPEFAQGKTSKDGVVNRYAIILGPDSFEARFWEAVDTFFNAFNQVLGIDSSDIYVLYDNGHPPEGYDQGDSVIIDYPVSQACLDTVFNRLVNEHQIDGDDHLYIIISGHGRTGIDPRVQPGDEPDSLESNFSPAISYALEKWTGEWESPNYHREKYVSHFEELHLESTNSDTTDDDIWIEKLKDYLAGDSVVTDGYIDTTVGEVVDFDGDGIGAYDAEADTFDEDDWGYIDTISEDNCRRSFIPEEWEFHCCLFDSSFDTTVDIDVDCGSFPDTPFVDGTDTNNDGIFDGIDMNSDNDMDDTVSIDEIIHGIDITDDVLAEYLDSLGERPTLVAMGNCFSGGFIWDLSRPKQVTMTGCRDHESCSGYFLHKIAETIFNPAIADSLDADSCVSLAEAFNYAAKLYGGYCTPVYDDNGDRYGHSYPVPDSGDGFWGRSLFFQEDCAIASSLFYYWHETGDSEGDDNGVVNPGDIINTEVTLENLDIDTAESVETILRTDDSFIEITDSLKTYGDIPPADTSHAQTSTSSR